MKPPALVDIYREQSTPPAEQLAPEPLSKEFSGTVEAALIEAPPLAAETIFRRSLLERLLLVCRRVGVKRFFIIAADNERTHFRASLGAFRAGSDVIFVGSSAEVLDHLPAETPCVAMRGNLVLSPFVLCEVIARQAECPGKVHAMQSTDDAHGGIVSAGTLSLLIDGRYVGAAAVAPIGRLPFALNEGRDDVREAERRLARDLRIESAWKDPPLARWIDRRLSWRISYRLARTQVTPNQVTFAGAVLGLLSAWLFAYPGYWPRLLAAALFLVWITLDGVDGELARLKLAESRSGARSRHRGRYPGDYRHLRLHPYGLLPGEWKPLLLVSGRYIARRLRSLPGRVLAGQRDGIRPEVDREG